MEDEEGLALCRDMHTTYDTLVLALTEATDSQNEIRCLESGC